MSEASSLPASRCIARRKLDVTEYHRMAAAGLLTEDDRVEGTFIAIASIGDRHVWAKVGLSKRLVRSAGDVMP